MAGGDSSGASYLLRACIFLLLLIVSLVQLLFFTLLPDIQLHNAFCNATLAHKPSAIDKPSSVELHPPPMRLFYQSLYLSPDAIVEQEELEKKQQQLQEELERMKAAADAKTKSKSVVDHTKNIRADLKSKQKGEKEAAAATEADEESHSQTEILLPKGFFLQPLGQGHEDVRTSRAAYCINVVTPSDSPGVLLDFELYLNVLPSSRPIYASVSKERLDMPPSVIDIYLERHPVDPKYYPNFHFPKDKAIWMMQNVEFFDRHELEHPTVGVMIVKNRIGLKKVLEYRHRHQLSYSVFYTKHTSNDIYLPEIERDWTTFLHLAGWSPFKSTRVIIQAWAMHPEWPKLTLRVIKADICKWVEDTYGKADEWRLANVDYKCGSEPIDMKIELQNKIGLHLCPSETEGFGHYINEARSVGALILTTNVAPMNELVDEQSGVLIGQAHEWWWQTKGDLFMPLAHVDIAAIEQGVERILLMSIEDRKRMGRRARAKFLEDRTYFLNAMAALEESLCQDEIRIDRLQPYLY